MADNDIASHYSQNDIVDRILAGLKKAGIDAANVSVDDLAPVDDFHTGGRVATAHLLRDLPIDSHTDILDIGCGIGGTCRYLADRFDVNVHGIDLTPNYIDAGNILNQWVSLDDKIDLQCGDALDIKIEDDFFDLAVMLHVGMNIKDKAALFAEAARLVKKGGKFAIYDVMQKEVTAIRFPVPWASIASMSYLEPKERYEHFVKDAGFTVERMTGRGDLARSFFRKMQEAARLSDGPSPMRLHLIVGSSIKEKMQNFSQAVYDGIVEPTEIIARKL